MNPRISIIIPTLNEANNISSTLRHLQPLRHRGCEVIVVDGGSTDATIPLAAALADQVLSARRGRARQMNAGAAVAQGEILLFLHADTALPHNADTLIFAARKRRPTARWGRFDVRIYGQHVLFPVIAMLMNLRSRLTGIATGDQGIFVDTDSFRACGGFPDLPLMEDIELSCCLKRLSAPLCLRSLVVTSGRRWQRHGVLRMIFFMWRLRLAYAFGANPDQLARYYGYDPVED